MTTSPRARTICVAALLAAASAIICGAGYERGYTGYTGSGYSRDQGPARPDTIKVRSRSVKFPNSAALAASYSKADSSFYDYDNKADNGTAIKYATIQMGAPDATYHANGANGGTNGWNRLYGLRVGDVTERTFEWVAGSQRLCYVWVSANGLRRGLKIERAHLMVNAGTGGVDLATTGNLLTVRLDTLSADYGILTGTAVGAAYGAANDYNMFAATWNQMDTDLNTDWSPALASRDDALDGVLSGDWHDFGPRSATTFSGNYAAGYCFRFDVTDAVQQRIDDQAFDPAKGFLFVLQIYGGTALAPTFSAGNHPVVAATSKGLPVFTAVASTRRGPLPWGDGKTKVALTFDDNKSDHTIYMPIVRAAGLKFTNVNQTEAFDVSPLTTFEGETVTRYDSLMAANPGGFEIVHHSKTHPAWGSLTGTQFDLELSKFPHYFTWYTVPDTTAISGFAHPGGTAPRYSFEGIGAIIRQGYASARGNDRKTGVAPNETPVGWVDYLAWDRPANLYTIAVYGISNVVCSTGITSRTSKASVKEALYDALDTMYQLDRSAFVMYAHSRAMDGLTAQNLQWFIEIVNESNNLDLINYYDLIELRRNGAQPMTPTEAAAWFDANGYNASIYSANVARWDTLSFFGEGYPDRVWIGPK